MSGSLGGDTSAWAALLRVHATLVPILDRQLQRAHGLPLSWYDLLLELDATPDGRLTMGRLGELAVLSRSRVSRMVDELVQAGLARKEANPDDRRSAYAVITPRGRQRRRQAAPTYLAAIEREFTARLSAREAQAIASGLAKVLAAHETHQIATRR